MGKINERYARLTDYRVCKKFDPRLSKPVFALFVKQKQIFLATNGTSILGYARLDYIWLKIPYLSWITVLENYRELGIATRLVHKIINTLTLQDHKFLLSSYQANAPISQNWHKKIGFKRCGKVDGINEDHSSELFCKIIF